MRRPSSRRRVGAGVAALLALAACVPSGRPVEGPESARSGDVRIVTSPMQLREAREVGVDLPDEGYLALFELLPGASVAMLYPGRDELVMGEDGTVRGLAEGGGRLSGGTHNVIRPDWRPDFNSLGRRADFQRRGQRRDILSYAYYCRTERPPLARSRWLLAVWSSAPLHPERLWTTRSDECGLVDARELAEEVVTRIVDRSGSARWSVDLVEY